MEPRRSSRATPRRRQRPARTPHACASRRLEQHAYPTLDCSVKRMRLLVSASLWLAATVATVAAATPAPIALTRFDSASAFNSGTFSGTSIDANRVVLG